MSGNGGGHPWTPAPEDDGAGGPESGLERGPRWVISLRAVVVVLAMAVAVAGVLWIEQAGVSNASGQLVSQNPAKLAVPPLPGATSTAGSQGASPTGRSGASEGGRPPPAAGEPPAAGDPPTAGGSILVHVVGAIKHPGVVSLTAGSRIFQALDAAGGALPTADLSALNLAAVAGDGTQIVVLTKEQAAAAVAAPGAGAGAPTGAGTPAAGSGGTALNLNTATAEQLDSLPGVGPVLAARIVAWRTDHGPFASVDELDAVSGIGTKMLATLRPLVVVQ